LLKSPNRFGDKIKKPEFQKGFLKTPDFLALQFTVKEVMCRQDAGSTLQPKPVP
jgi:hypothetical protein